MASKKNRRQFFHYLGGAGMALMFPSITHADIDKDIEKFITIATPSLWSGEYAVAQELTHSLFWDQRRGFFAKPDGKANVGRVKAFDSYGRLVQDVVRGNTASCLLPLEFFNQGFSFANNNGFAFAHFRAIAIVASVPVFLVVRRPIETWTELIMHKTMRHENNFLLSYLLDYFIAKVFDENVTDITAFFDNDSLVEEDDDNPNIFISPTTVERREGDDLSSEENSLDEILSTSESRAQVFLKNNVGYYNYDEEVLDAFANKEIDWFFHFGFFDQPMGYRFLIKQNARVMKIENNFFPKKEFFTAEEVKDRRTLRRNISFTFPLVWLVKRDAPDIIVRHMLTRLRDRRNISLLNIDNDDGFLLWQGKKFRNLRCHQAIL